MWKLQRNTHTFGQRIHTALSSNIFLLQSLSHDMRYLFYFQTKVEEQLTIDPFVYM